MPDHFPIATVTLNPAIDLSFAVDRLHPLHKMRGDSERQEPGGGGINVSRVVARLGGTAPCHYFAGGAGGAALDHLLDLHRLVKRPIPIAGSTRISTTVLERAGNAEYRFTTSGPEISPGEWTTCLERFRAPKCSWLVLSGTLPPGVPDAAYAQIAGMVAPHGVKVVLDSSGRGLAGGLCEREIFLVKPSLGELRALAGGTLGTPEGIAAAAKRLVAAGAARHVAVTLGEAGALLVGDQIELRLPAIAVERRSAVGAGDSFLAAMVFALSQGKAIEEAFRHGIAAGAAAVMTPGTGLAEPADIERLLPLVSR